MPTHLTIAYKPIKSSYLAIPPSPFSPKFPNERLGLPPPIQRTKHAPRIDISPPPAEPRPWVWQCHKCNRAYQLGVTRRCLNDGHYFCAGTIKVKKNKYTGEREEIYRGCASVFDYRRWKNWGTWKRDVAEQIEAATVLEAFLNDQPTSETLPLEGRSFNGIWARRATFNNSSSYHLTRDCWNTCDHPCGWDRRAGAQNPIVSLTPATVTVPSSQISVSSDESEKKTMTSFDDILLNIPLATGDLATKDEVSPPTQSSPTQPEANTKKPSMNDLLESAKRRKRRSAGQTRSPLASNPPSPTEAGSLDSTETILQKALDNFELDFRTSAMRSGSSSAPL